MADVKPLKLEYDGDGTPSGIGEFVSGDTVAQAHLNITSLDLTNLSASSITTSSISASSITWSGSLSSTPSSTIVLKGDMSVSGNLSVSGNISGTGNIGVVGQIMCGQTGPGTADLNVVDDNSDATIEINSGSNNDSLIQFRENNAWRCNLGWNGGANDFYIKNLATGDINLDPYTGYTVSASCSSITVSSCPVPPPWSFTEVTADDGQNSASPYYFASGSTQAKNEIGGGHITWDSTNSYFTIANAGYYEFAMNGSITVGSSPTTVTLSIIQTTGLGGTEIEKIDKIQTIRTNMDPHNANICWMGYCAAANFTCKLDGDGTVRMEKGSTFSCKRIN